MAGQIGIGFMWLTAGFLFARYGLARLQGKRVAYIAIWDGSSWEGGRASITPEGVTFLGVSYQQPVLYPLLLVPGVVLYLVLVERVALATHQQLEVARRSAKPTLLFKGGGDMLFLLQVMATMVPVFVCLYFVLSLGGLQARVDALAVEVSKANTVLSKPLVIDIPGSAGAMAPTGVPSDK
jgi:hypothetical protein